VPKQPSILNLSPLTAIDDHQNRNPIAWAGWVEEHCENSWLAMGHIVDVMNLGGTRFSSFALLLLIFSDLGAEDATDLAVAAAAALAALVVAGLALEESNHRPVLISWKWRAKNTW